VRSVRVDEDSGVYSLLFFMICGRLLIHFLLRGASRSGVVWDGPPPVGSHVDTGGPLRRRHTIAMEQMDVHGCPGGFPTFWRIVRRKGEGTNNQSSGGPPV
jgi:hypothetical protein